MGRICPKEKSLLLGACPTLDAGQASQEGKYMLFLSLTNPDNALSLQS